jgi:hypothetical protein
MKKLSKKSIGKVLAGIGDGKTNKALAARFKVTKGAIAYWRKKFNEGTAYVSQEGAVVGVSPTETATPPLASTTAI